MTHTPGPWAMRKPVECKDPRVEFWVDANDTQIPIADIKSNGSPEANARLIAAAPDLLAALEVAYAALEGTTEEQDDAQDLALAALIKARGKNHRYLPSAHDVARIIDSVNRCHEEGE